MNAEQARLAYLRGYRASREEEDCEQDFAFKPDGFEAEYRRGWKDGKDAEARIRELEDQNTALKRLCDMDKVQLCLDLEAAFDWMMTVYTPQIVPVRFASEFEASRQRREGAKE